MQSALLGIVIVVTVATLFPPLPIHGIRPMPISDMPVGVFVVAALVDVALSLLCPLTVAAGGTQPLCQLARHHCLRGGGMQSALLYVVVVVAVVPQSPPSPIPSICQTWTPDTPVDVIIVNTVIYIALSPSPPLPTASHGTGMACPAPPTSHRGCSRRLHILVRASTPLALAANDNAMPSILSRSSTSDKSAPPRTKEIIPLSPLPRPPSSPFALISTPPGMLPLKPCSVNNPTRVHPQDVV